MISKLALIYLVFLTPIYFLIYFVILILRFIIPFKAFAYLDEKFYSLYQRQFLLFYEKLGTNKIFVYGDVTVLSPKYISENVLYLGNHQSTYDWFVADILIARQGGIGRLRFILQHMLKYIPFFGLVVYFHNFIFVNRRKFNAQAANKALRTLKKRKLPFWLILYPEGTRINPLHTEVFTKSVKFAESSGIEPYTYHLTPRTTGLELVFKNLAQEIDAIYDVTIVYADEYGNPRDRRLKMPGLTNWLDFKHSIHVHIDRIPIENVPTDDKEQFRKWLFDRFRIKETFFKRLYEPSRYKDAESAKKVAGRVKAMTTCVPWNEYVELEPASLQHTKNMFKNLLKPSTGTAISIDPSDGSLKPLSFAGTWLPTMTFIGIELFLIYFSLKLYFLIMFCSYLVAAIGLVFLHQTD